MPVSPTRIKYLDKQVQLLVKDFTSISSTIVENADPGSLIPEGISGERLMNSLLTLLTDLIRSNPYTASSGTLKEFALRIIGMLGTLNLGVYGDVINRIKRGDNEIVTMFSVELMKELATKPAAALRDPDTIFYVNVIKATLDRLMQNSDFTYMLLTPQAYVTFGSPVPEPVVPVIIPSGNTSLVAGLAVVPQTPTPTLNGYLVSLSSYASWQYNTLNTKLKESGKDLNDYVFYGRAVSGEANGRTLVKAYLSILRELNRHVTQNHMVVSIDADLSAFPTRLLLYRRYSDILSSVNDTATVSYSNIKTQSKFRADQCYAFFRVLQTITAATYSYLTPVLNATSGISSGNFRQGIALMKVVYELSNKVTVTGNNSFSYATSILSTSAVYIKAKRIAETYTVSSLVQVGDSSSFIYEQIKTAIIEDTIAAYKNKLLTTEDKRLYTPRSIMLTIVALTYARAFTERIISLTEYVLNTSYDGPVELTDATIGYKNLQMSEIRKAQNTLQIGIKVLNRLFSKRNGYFMYVNPGSADTTLAKTVPTGSRLAPYAMIYPEGTPASQTFFYSDLLVTKIHNLISFIANSPVGKRTHGLTDQIEIDLYNEALLLHHSFANYSTPELIEAINSGSRALIALLKRDPLLGVQPLNNFMLYSHNEYNIPNTTSGEMDDYTSYELSKIDFIPTEGLVQYTP